MHQSKGQDNLGRIFKCVYVLCWVYRSLCSREGPIAWVWPLLQPAPEWRADWGNYQQVRVENKCLRVGMSLHVTLM